MAKPLSAEQIDERRTSLIEAALAILETDGDSGLTIRRLAESTGVSRQTPYLYFKDKAALCDAMCVTGMRRLTASIAKGVAEAPPLEPIEQMRLAGEAYVRFGLENPALYSLIFRPAQKSDNPSDEFLAAIDENIEVTRVLMQKAWEDGLLALPPERLNHVFWATMHGLISLRIDGLVSEDDVFQQMLSDIEITLANGFIASKNSPSAS